RRHRDAGRVHAALSRRHRQPRRGPGAATPRHHGSRRMSTNTLPRYAHRRGTRGFAAFVVGLAGFVVLGVGAVVLPTTTLGSLALSWLVPLTVAFGIAHFVAAYGLI